MDEIIIDLLTIDQNVIREYQRDRRRDFNVSAGPEWTAKLRMKIKYTILK